MSLNADLREFIELLNSRGIPACTMMIAYPNGEPIALPAFELFEIE